MPQASEATRDHWYGCYAQRWRHDMIDAPSHPAKMPPLLAQRIYCHATEQEWISAGDSVLDPFAGIGGTALAAAQHGLRWTGCEIEPEYVRAGEANFALWERRHARCSPLWQSPRMLHADARTLLDSVKRESVALIVSSPPFGSGHSAGPETEIARARRDEAAGVDSKIRRFMGSQGWRGAGQISAANLAQCRSQSAYWEAAAVIVAQCAAALAPSGHAVFVCGNFVRSGALVEFDRQWATLCGEHGLRLVHVHKASKIEHRGTQRALDGTEQPVIVSRLNFLRKIKNAETGITIDSESVLCMEKSADKERA